MDAEIEITNEDKVPEIIPMWVARLLARIAQARDEGTDTTDMAWSVLTHHGRVMAMSGPYHENGHRYLWTADHLPLAGPGGHTWVLVLPVRPAGSMNNVSRALPGLTMPVADEPMSGPDIEQAIAELQAQRDRAYENATTLGRERDEMERSRTAIMQDRDQLIDRVNEQSVQVATLTAERDKARLERDEAQEWLIGINRVLGEDRGKAAFIDEAVGVLVAERDDLRVERDHAHRRAGEAREHLRVMFRELGWVENTAADQWRMRDDNTGTWYATVTAAGLAPHFRDGETAKLVESLKRDVERADRASDLRSEALDNIWDLAQPMVDGISHPMRRRERLQAIRAEIEDCTQRVRALYYKAVEGTTVEHEGTIESSVLEGEWPRVWIDFTGFGQEPNEVMEAPASMRTALPRVGDTIGVRPAGGGMCHLDLVKAVRHYDGKVRIMTTRPPAATGGGAG